jgi:hypothetical protein
VPVDHRIVGHHCLRRLEAELGEGGQGALERARVRLGVLARVELDVGEPAVVVDDAVQVVVLLGREAAAASARTSGFPCSTSNAARQARSDSASAIWSGIFAARSNAACSFWSR